MVFDENRVQIEYWMVLNVLLLMFPLSIFVHESGHAIMATLFGIQVRKFVVGLTGGYVLFIKADLMELTALQIYLVYVAGGVAESLLYYVLGKKVFRGFYAGIILTLPYGLWEGIRGWFLLMNPGEEIRILHAAILEPVILISALLAMGILSYCALYPKESG